MQSGIASCGGEDSDAESGSESGASSTDEAVDPKRLTWYLAGTPVCRRAFLQMLGVSCQRLSRTRGHFRGLDERTLKGQKSNTRAATATASVSVFMQKMYFSVSESMPTGFLI